MARQIIILGDVAAIPLTQGLWAVIDASDAHLVEGHNWHAYRSARTFYASTSSILTGRKTASSLHRTIMGDPAGFEIDHIDGDGLNCQRSNLRLATKSQNAFNRGLGWGNRSGFKGVSWCGNRKKWRATIVVSQRQKHLGLFTDPEAAYAAYLAAAATDHGEFARVA